MGALDGLIKGGSTGATAGPQGAAIGAALGLATGLVQDIKANKLKKQAEAAMPELVDPNQAAFLSELNQKRKSIETGADFASGMRAIDTTQAGTNDAITRNTGGDGAATIQALLQSQATAGNSKNQVLASGQQNQLAYTGMYGQQLNKIAARKLQLQLLQEQQKMAEWAKMKQQGNQNTNAGAAGGLQQILSGMGGSGAGAGMPSASFDGAAAPGMSGKPAADPLSTFIPSGASAPGIIPQANLATAGLGLPL